MKAKVVVNEIDQIMEVEITSNDRSIEDIERTARIVKNYQNEFDILKIFYDHSKFEWKFDYVNEYKLAKDFKKLLPYEENTKIAFYLGSYYKEHYWELMKKIISENSNIGIEYFGSKRNAINWLYE